jgi:5-methyltetrahydrofolate--homocysteine methyltransferase
MSNSITHQLQEILKNRIMLLDGAMGTMIQRHSLGEDDFRGEHFPDHPSSLKGDNDLLAITRPDIIQSIHEEYFEVGSDFATTNSFNATTIAQADYDMEAAVYDINYQAAQCARRAADVWTAKTPDKPRFVIGALGPTNRTASLSPDVNDPGKRLVTFDELRQAYFDGANALLEGGADILMIETVFDTLNAKAGLYAMAEIRDKWGEVPVMVSGTITDASGRTLSGQTAEAFWISMMHGELLSVGLNCALGANEMLPYVKRLDSIASCFISAHPNAGLPNEFGEYDETPEQMADQVEQFVKGGHVNILGGCCGTTPEHIAALADLAKKYSPRTLKES